MSDELPDAPLVSILTPSFNQAPWLMDNLRSVDAQTYKSIEHIVMDGGSLDGSVDVLKAAGPRVKWRSEPDGGQSDALLKALSLSRGEIIGWVNSDDGFADTRAVERAVDVFMREPTVDVVYGDVLEVTTGNLVIGVSSALAITPLVRFLRINPVRQPGAFIRRRAIGGRFVDPDLHYVMDHEFFLRLLDRGAVFRRLPIPVAINRRTPGRKTMSVSERAVAEHRAIFGSRRGIAGALRHALRYIISVANRFGSLPSFLLLDRRLSPAVPLRIPTQSARLRFQLATRLDAYVLHQSQDQPR